jgi:hypothetical protein
MFIGDGRHDVHGARIAPVRGALLHFKFFQDFTDKVYVEADREVHWKNAREYKAYRRHLDEHKDVCFVFPGSIRYRDEAQLLELGFMACDPDYAGFMASFDDEGSRCTRAGQKE